MADSFFDKDKFYFPVRVYYEDTDAGGVVYYANYLRFAERARTEFVRSLGVGQNKNLNNENPCAFVVCHCEADYKSPAVLDDLLTVVSEIEQMSAVSLVVKQNIFKDDKLLVALKIKVAYISLKNKRPQRLPSELNSWYAATTNANEKNCDNSAG